MEAPTAVQLPRCRSGRHTWFEQEDADRCCDPRYRRELRLKGTYARRVWVHIATGREDRPTAWGSLL
jgi:hypothetical protein